MVLGLKAVRGLKARRVAFGLAYAAVSLLALFLSAVLSAVAANLLSYRLFIEELPLAVIEFSRVSPRQFAVIVEPQGRLRSVHELHGDEWRLDARFIRTSLLPGLLRKNPVYRLERLEGRTRGGGNALSNPSASAPLVFATGFDPWNRMPSALRRWLGVDVLLLSSPNSRMVDGARYEVRGSSDGLSVRRI